jgi:hypothetical protein
VHRHRLLGLQGQRDVTGLGLGPEVGQGLAGQFGQVQRLRLGRRAAGLVAGQGQQLLDQAGGAVDALAQGLDGGAAFGVGGRP